MILLFVLGAFFPAGVRAAVSSSSSVTCKSDRANEGGDGADDVS